MKVTMSGLGLLASLSLLAGCAEPSVDRTVTARTTTTTTTMQPRPAQVVTTVTTEPVSTTMRSNRRHGDDELVREDTTEDTYIAPVRTTATRTTVTHTKTP